MVKETLQLLLVAGLALAPVAMATGDDDDFKAADTSSPRDTLRSFIDSCNDLHLLITSSPHYYDRADPRHIALSERTLDCIDSSELPPFARRDRAGEAAIFLKEILDRVELPPWEEIPDSPEIQAAGGFENLKVYRIPDTRITISRVETGPRRHEYLFSPGTVERARRYYRSLEARPYRTEGPEVSENFYEWYKSAPGHPALAAVIDRLPDWLRVDRTGQLANWKWAGLAVAVILAFALLTAVYRWQVVLTGRVRERSTFKYWLTLSFPIIAILIPLGLKYVSYRYLTLRGTPLYTVDFCSLLVAMVATGVVIFSLGNRTAASIIASPQINSAGLNAQLIRIVSKLSSATAVVALFLVGGQHLGIPVATLLTSAGIGGVAVALGAQDTLKTLFGTINLLSDRPCRVGDRIIFRGYDGVVEDIGLRSTRLRLLSGSQVTIPNDQLAGNDVQNVGRRDYIRKVGEIHIPLDTTCQKVERAVAIIKEELEDHEGMDPDRSPKVFFREFAPGAFCIQFTYWYSPADRWKCRAFNDRLNFELFRKFEAEGIQFSLPFRHSFWKRDDEQGPLDVSLFEQGTEPDEEG